MDADDVAYRKSVRNMSVVLAIIVMVILIALFVPPYLNPSHDVFLPAVSLNSPFGFAMHLTVNVTSGAPTWSVMLRGWVNSTSPSIENVTSSDSWALPHSGLWMGPCPPGCPLGVGVMQGHYTQDNYTQGTLLPLDHVRSPPCPGLAYCPTSFALEPYGSKALVVLGGTPNFWELETSLHLTGTTPGYLLQPGVYTAVLADEWGDILTTNFQIA